MADHSVGAQDEYESEASEASVFCFDNASSEKSCFVDGLVCPVCSISLCLLVFVFLNATRRDRNLLFIIRFSSFPWVLRKLINQSRHFVQLYGCYASLSITTNLTKRSQFFHPSLNKLNFLQLRSTKLSVFNLNSSAFHLLFGHVFHVRLQTTRVGHVFDLLCNQSSLSFSLSDGFTEVFFPVVYICPSSLPFIFHLFH